MPEPKIGNLCDFPCLFSAVFDTDHKPTPGERRGSAGRPLVSFGAFRTSAPPNGVVIIDLRIAGLPLIECSPKII